MQICENFKCNLKDALPTSTHMTRNYEGTITVF